MGLRRRIEIPLYRVLKPLALDPSERRQLPSAAQDTLLEQQPRRVVQILRSKVAAVVLAATLAGGGGVLIGGYVEGRAGDADLAAAQDEQISDWQESAEWRANHDVCMAEHEAREGGDAGIFTAAADPKLDQCYVEQQLQVADIRAEASD